MDIEIRRLGIFHRISTGYITCLAAIFLQSNSSSVIFSTPRISLKQYKPSVTRKRKQQVTCSLRLMTKNQLNATLCYTVTSVDGQRKFLK